VEGGVGGGQAGVLGVVGHDDGREGGCGDGAWH
jgi:hypothetical protein